jgi:hypothetical protein
VQARSNRGWLQPTAQLLLRAMNCLTGCLALPSLLFWVEA